MTAKRFTLKHFESQDWAYDNGTYIDTRIMVELLNELHEEVENLKDVNTQCCNDYSAMRRDVLRYKEENEQLKKENEELKQLLEDDITRRCEIKEVCEERWGNNE